MPCRGPCVTSHVIGAPTKGTIDIIRRIITATFTVESMQLSRLSEIDKLVTRLNVGKRFVLKVFNFAAKSMTFCE